MFKDAHEHLQAELRRLDLILLAHLHASGPVGDAVRVERERLARLLDPEGELDSPEAAEAGLQRQIAAIRARLRESLADGVRLPLVELCRALGLDGIGVGLLVLACASHFDRKYGAVFAYLQGDRTRTLPRVELAVRLLGGGESLQVRRWCESPGPLLRSGHVRVGEDGEAGPLLERAIVATPRLARHLLGIDAPEQVVAATAMVPPLVAASRSQRAALARVARVWHAEERPGPLAVIVDDDAEGLAAGAGELAEQRGVQFLAIDLSRPAGLRFAVEARVREAFREATLRGALLCVLGWPQLAEQEREPALRELAAELEEFDGPCIVVADAAARLRREVQRRSVLELRVVPPDTDERAELWREVLAGEAGEVDVAELAWRYRLGASEIRDAAQMAEADARSLGGEVRERMPAALVRACRARSRPELGALAQAIAARGEWSDLILPEASLEQLHELVRHLKYHDLVFGTWGLRSKVLHGDGVAALFAGPPGTGKTMASALVARELGRELLRVELAGVVSKYIGETEKNLERVFVAARRSNAVLFFDEADALFGKRSEVKDAHDRYANVETSYLLQRVEEFDGVIVLATNFKKNVDEAFMRRMAVVVDFPPPEPAERRRLWASLMPAAMPREDEIDLDFLAQRFELSGGHIKNAIQTAAMLAAEAHPRVVRFAHLLVGVRREMRKLGRVVDPADFGRYRAVYETGVRRT
ncbi:AAA family ATPase [Nannocystis punicea]|uniref:ATP-binding protein n=1 Tax=Nannocystis punicea TaxID=2995304 RepID=A0ABY7H6E0_9BACT|nr:ATP-binding protein [Nannocystis poenicansa]WAS94841.1 ATP-binding protein [Nannocystis poenicansa]